MLKNALKAMCLYMGFVKFLRVALPRMQRSVSILVSMLRELRAVRM